MPSLDPTRRFLLLCLRGRWEPAALETARALAMRGDLDWDTLHQVARTEGLIPLLYDAVRGQNLVPPSLERTLRRAYEWNAYRNTVLLHELASVLSHLVAENVSVILLKGAALAETVYGNAAVRPMIDLDLLVRREDVPAALRGLAALSYTPTDVETRAGTAIEHENEVMLCKTGLITTCVELHWSLLDSPYYQHTLPMDWFWQTAVPLRTGEARARVLGPEAQVLYLCAHVLLHHGGQGLLWLHDVAEVIAFYRARIDWEQVLARAQAYDLVLPLQQILIRVANEWGAPIPDRALDRLRTLQPSPTEERVFTWLTAERRPVAQRFWADLASMPGWQQRLRFTWINLFPSPAYMQHRYHIPHPVLLPLYYPFRWFLGLRSALWTDEVLW